MLVRLRLATPTATAHPLVLPDRFHHRLHRLRAAGGGAARVGGRGHPDRRHESAELDHRHARAGLATLFLTFGGLRYLMAGGDPGEVEAAKLGVEGRGHPGTPWPSLPRSS
ncbi:hypothetical protein ACRAWF_38060 [Streptomyces sp. L7]